MNPLTLMFLAAQGLMVLIVLIRAIRWAVSYYVSTFPNRCPMCDRKTRFKTLSPYDDTTSEDRSRGIEQTLHRYECMFCHNVILSRSPFDRNTKLQSFNDEQTKTERP
jgi:hypothetical protein